MTPSASTSTDAHTLHSRLSTPDSESVGRRATHRIHRGRSRNLCENLWDDKSAGPKKTDDKIPEIFCASIIARKISAIV